MFLTGMPIRRSSSPSGVRRTSSPVRSSAVQTALRSTVEPSQIPSRPWLRQSYVGSRELRLDVIVIGPHDVLEGVCNIKVLSSGDQLGPLVNDAAPIWWVLRSGPAQIPQIANSSKSSIPAMKRSRRSLCHRLARTGLFPSGVMRASLFSQNHKNKSHHPTPNQPSVFVIATRCRGPEWPGHRPRSTRVQAEKYYLCLSVGQSHPPTRGCLSPRPRRDFRRDRFHTRRSVLCNRTLSRA